LISHRCRHTLAIETAAPIAAMNHLAPTAFFIFGVPIASKNTALASAITLPLLNVCYPIVPGRRLRIVAREWEKERVFRFAVAVGMAGVGEIGGWPAVAAVR